MTTVDLNILKSRVKEPVQFHYFRDGALYYKCADGYVFAVPVSDTSNNDGGNPTFNATEKGITMMRWIRKQMVADNEQERAYEAARQEWAEGLS